MRDSKASIFSITPLFDGCARIAAFSAAITTILFQLMSVVEAQDAAFNPVENGGIGFAGMLAGLLVIALATLALRHRRNEAAKERVLKLEAALEERDDRIWSLEEQLIRTNKFADAQGDLVIREDSLGRITYASEKIAALLDKPVGQIVGHSVALDVRQERNRVTHTDGSISYDQKIASADGYCWIAWKEVAVRDEGGRLAETQRVGRDVTTRVTAEHIIADAHEKAEAASRAKSRFLAVVSHEVRTPLNGVLGMADLLLETGLSPEQQTYARAMKTSGEALLALIEEILDFSKIEAGRLDLESIPFDVGSLVTDVVELLSPRAQGKGIEIAAYVDDKIPVRVMGDAARLRQVLLNLAGNAVKFTDTGGVSVLVEPGANGRVEFSVRDTGPGIGAEMQARIFDEFEQGDGTLGRRHGGTGLGLAIAARIVERMGGEIALHSAIERGSVFSFSADLPAVAGSETITMPDLTGRDILIASSSPVVGPLLERRLSAWGANVSLANDVRVAETLLPEREWSHVMIDRALGIVGTVSLAQRAALHTGQLLVLLGPAERGELADLKSAGFDGYFVKPVRGASLAARLAVGETEATLVPDFDADDAVARRPQRALAVLVAEDNDINALLAQAMLGKLGHIPTVVADGVSAVSAIKAAHVMGAPYDLILMDLHLPGMDGLEATRRIRAMGEKGGQVPIIALTANAFAEDREACRAAGMNAFIVKPFDRDRLDEAIAAARGTQAGQKTHAA